MKLPTNELLKALFRAYPTKGFHIIPYTVDGVMQMSQPYVFQAIVFTHDGFQIHDPTVDVIGSKPCDPLEYYGIEEALAEKLRRHNVHYDIWAVKKGVDLHKVFDQVVAEIENREDKSENPIEFLEGLGFEEYHTGGGCMAMCLEDPKTRWQILVTDNDASLPERFDDIFVGMTDDDSSDTQREFSLQIPLPPPPLDEKGIDDLAEDALNALCLTVQTKLGQTDGGPAGMFFSDGEVKEKIKEYIVFEFDYLPKGK